MWTEVKNKTDFSWKERNSSQTALLQLTEGSLAALHSNGSAVTTHPSQTAPPVVRGSGIIPGGIAAAVFISFLLALYTLLWKCMVAAPKRKERKAAKARGPRDVVC